MSTDWMWDQIKQLKSNPLTAPLINRWACLYTHTNHSNWYIWSTNLSMLKMQFGEIRSLETDSKMLSFFFSSNSHCCVWFMVQLAFIRAHNDGEPQSIRPSILWLCAKSILSTHIGVGCLAIHKGRFCTPFETHDNKQTRNDGYIVNKKFWWPRGKSDFLRGRSRDIFDKHTTTPPTHTWATWNGLEA